MNASRTVQVQRSAPSWITATIVFTNIGLACLVACALYFFGSVGEAIAYVRGQRLFASADGVVTAVEGQTQEFDLVVRNMGGRRVRILGGQSSCSCLVALGVPTDLPARGRLVIRVSFRPKRRTGQFSQAIRLFTDDLDQSDLDVLVNCQVTGSSEVKKKGAPRSAGGGDAVRSKI